MPYQKTTWINNNEPSINAQNLNKIEQGIYDNSTALETLSGLLDGHMVRSDVPSNAVFTDTTYTAGDNVQIIGTVISAKDTVYDDTEITNRITTAESDIEDLDEATEHLSDGDTVYPYASEIEIEDALGVNAKDVKVKIEPVQDLHGYDKPWAGGAGKNLIPMTVASIKTANTTGTWSGNVYTLNDITWSIQTDSDSNVVGIKANGTASANADFVVGSATYDSMTLEAGQKLNGSNGGSSSTYGIAISGKGIVQTNGEDYTVDSTTTGNKTIYIRIVSGIQVSNKTFYPMVRLATETDPTFEPYSNICPISGFTEANILDHGKNLIGKTGGWDGNGEYQPTAQAICSEKMSVSEGDKFIASKAQAFNASWSHIYVLKFDSSDNYIGQEAILQYAALNGSDYSIPSGVAKVAFSVYFNSTDASKINDIKAQVERGNTITSYTPYVAPHTATIQLGDTIYGGTLDVTTGTCVMTVDRAIVDMGDLTYNYNQSLGIFGTSVISDRADFDATKVQVMCSVLKGLTAKDGSGMSEADDNTIAFNDGNVSKFLRIKCTAYTDGTAFKTAMTGQKIVYELATPITIQLTPQQIHLLEGYNLISANTGDISITTTDIQGAIGQADELIEANTQAIHEIDSFNDSIFGTVETGTTASKAYAQGDYFVKDKKMCKTLTSIAQGATFTLNTNYAAYTIAEILKAIETL